jgi:hypothetical protein
LFKTTLENYSHYKINGQLCSLTFGRKIAQVLEKVAQKVAKQKYAKTSTSKLNCKVQNCNMTTIFDTLKYLQPIMLSNSLV